MVFTMTTSPPAGKRTTGCSKRLPVNDQSINIERLAVVAASFLTNIFFLFLLTATSYHFADLAMIESDEKASFLPDFKKLICEILISNE